ncbi:hypothetical protein [Nonomuraea sp. NPDC049784]|uniref:hypothetical protein n=1 Tax=Nonomuraea sp. NPDC049784 TaxID=3154361 RepID=UPI0033D97FC5
MGVVIGTFPLFAIDGEAAYGVVLVAVLALDAQRVQADVTSHPNDGGGQVPPRMSWATMV